MAEPAWPGAGQPSPRPPDQPTRARVPPWPPPAPRGARINARRLCNRVRMQHAGRTARETLPAPARTPSGAGRPTFPFGTHLAVAEVDTETGKARLVRLVTVDDAGTVVNPVLAEGQRHGGIAQGVAQALLEEMVYDPDGNP